MLSSIRRFRHVFAIAAIAMAVSLVAVDFAEARRGGGFGSRGTRTFSAPPVTRTAPNQAAPVDRTMAPRPQQNATTPNAARPQNAPQNRGLFGGLAGGLLGGLFLGGLFGMLMGSGFGGAAGFLGMLLQIALIGGLVMLAMRFFARRQQPAGGPSSAGHGHAYQSPQGEGRGFQIPKIGGLAGGVGASASQAVRQASDATDEIGITNRDLDQFEKLLKQVQAAYAAEDYAALRAITTPEAMSYLAEELGENATSGLKNDVRDVTLLQGDLSEAWRENGQEYATVAMRYSSIDVMRDRNTGTVVQGDPDNATETVEIWTFVRKPAQDWQLSAIQNAV
ncbi:Import inner membrane translocase subunit Tim44 [Pseudorhizobium banfieldiae]|uniref:Import inner membrane translocase subunit Tim44 n=1 Tax=Pseudorhizobium banfieldiae TaxID=1125847 RepID=L0NH17_9HYPH|nr:Tim44 domain-containing protein [Pseudorhizobium banfieldiae]CAD6615908.1 membrane protein [arsenite-oxidising bacterium NT-25]CAD6618875.1 membrane protein [Rhizobium sp. TCK]CCF20370.1 Import inner membrane translocase subunit Tim44 [Pseudorhizobium banfieldiae]